MRSFKYFLIRLELNCLWLLLKSNEGTGVGSDAVLVELSGTGGGGGGGGGGGVGNCKLTGKWGPNE